MISSMMRGLDEEKKRRVTEAQAEAMKASSEMKEKISPAEWKKIMRAALDESELAKHAKTSAENSDKSDAKNMSRSHRC